MNLEELDHNEALEDLPSRFDKAENLRGLLAGLLAGVQTLEEGVVGSGASLKLSDASGDVLDDVYGNLLSQVREGLTDEEYRLVLSSRLRALGSRGTANELLEILLSLTGAESVDYHESPGFLWFHIGYTVVSALDSTWLRILLRHIEAARPAGVFDYEMVEAVSPPFGFEGDEDAMGFGDGHLSDELSDEMEALI